jgi:short-subunit dehydrogenase
MAIDLQGKTIVITGASAGIGRAVALACAAAGMHVVVAARREDVLADVVSEIETQGGKALAVACDVTRDEDVEALTQRVVGELGRIDAFLANAGYGLCMPVIDTPDDKARAIFETNFWGTIRCLRAAVPIMKQQGGGHILICASAASEIAMPLYSFYCATKAAQDSVAGSLRAELSGTGIHVTTIHPIGTRTDFWQSAKQQSDLDEGALGLNTPDMLMQSADHVARCVVKALHRPRSEVWPSMGSRFGLALTTAFPWMGSYVMRRLWRKNKRLAGE